MNLAVIPLYNSASPIRLRNVGGSIFVGDFLKKKGRELEMVFFWGQKSYISSTTSNLASQESEPSLLVAVAL